MIIAVTMRPRPLLPIALAALAGVALLAAAGCGSTVQEDTTLTVHTSLPLSGPDALEGRAILGGAERALADAGGEAQGATVVLENSDSASPGAGVRGRWDQATIAANARAATQDSRSIAYLGEISSDATRISAPITNEAGLLHVSPFPLDRDLLAAPGGNDVPEDVQTTGERTLGSIMPADLQMAFAFAELEGPRSAPAPGTAIGGPEHPYFAYGYEAMAVILDSIERAQDPLDRADVVAAFMATSDRKSDLGTYSIGPDGAAAYAGGLFDREGAER